MSKWLIYTGEGGPKDKPAELTPEEFVKRAPAPPWRKFKGEAAGAEYRPPPDEQTQNRGPKFKATPQMVQMVNTAIHLRRPLLVTGDPGVGKSSLARAVAWELGLGGTLYWGITTRTTLQEGLYHYDAFGRLQELQTDHLKREIRRLKSVPHTGKLESTSHIGKLESMPHTDVADCRPDVFSEDAIGRYIRLGPLGTALLPSTLPKVLLIDEIDKSDIDLPNDLLNVFEEGEFEIPELKRLEDVCPEVPVRPCGKGDPVVIRGGLVQCKEFPIVIMTSNQERELPAPFLRRCLRLDIKKPEKGELAAIVLNHFDSSDPETEKIRDRLIDDFLKIGADAELATDQLLNAIHLVAPGGAVDKGVYEDWETLRQHVFRALNEP